MIGISDVMCVLILMAVSFVAGVHYGLDKNLKEIDELGRRIADTAAVVEHVEAICSGKQ
jgi:hypothetical protein